MKQKHQGPLSEIVACAWLLRQGYEVFRNISFYGEADIIAMNFSTKEVILIDVKTVRPGMPISNAMIVLTDSQKELGVRILAVEAASGACEFIEAYERGTKKCNCCTKEFIPRTRKSKFCSSECQGHYWRHISESESAKNSPRRLARLKKQPIAMPSVGRLARRIAG